MNQYMDKQSAAAEFGVSVQTIEKWLKEMEPYIGPGKRYKAYATRGHKKTLQVRYAVLDDYVRNREYLGNPSTEKAVPPFDVRAAEAELGISNAQIVMIDAEKVAELVMQGMAKAFGTMG